MVQGAAASVFQAFGPVLLLELQCSLGGPEIVQDLVGKECIDELTAGLPDLFGLEQAPLRIVHDVGLGLWWQVFLDGGLAPRL